MPQPPATEAQAPVAMPPIPDANGVKPAAAPEEQAALAESAAASMPTPPPLQVANARPNTAPVPPSNTAKVPDIQPVGGHRPVEVIATRDGFYRQRRMVEGVRFTVPSMAKVGSWMKCVDPVLEKEHQKILAEKRKAAGNK